MEKQIFLVFDISLIYKHTCNKNFQEENFSVKKIHSADYNFSMFPSSAVIPMTKITTRLMRYA